MSELDAALHLLHPLDEDLEVGGVTIFLESAGETPPPPPPDRPGVRRHQANPPRTPLFCEVFPREPTWCPALPPPTHAPSGQPHPNMPFPLSGKRGAHNRGPALWQERPGTLLLLLVVTTRRDPERVLRVTTSNLYGAAPVTCLALPAPEARDGVHAFLRTQEVIAVTGVHLVRLPPGTTDDPRGPRGLSPTPDWRLWRGNWAEWLARLVPKCRWMATGP